MTEARDRQPIERNIAMELVRVTEAAAMSAARYMGMGDKELVDQAAVDAMRFTLGSIPMDGTVVIGEGEKDEAPMLYVGERIGDGSPPHVDIAVDPIDGTTLLSKGLPGAIAAVALSASGTMHVPGNVFYVNKIAVGKEAKDVIDINAPVEANLRGVAKAKGRRVEELTVVVLDRPRHERLLAEIRAAGARVKLISDGDVAAGIQAALPESGVDMLMGIGGTPEGVLTAAAIRCVGGAIQCKAWPRDEQERQAAVAAGVGPGKGVHHRGAGGWRRRVLCGHGRELRRPAERRAVLCQRRADPLAGDAGEVRHHPVDRLGARLHAAGQGPLPGVGVGGGPPMAGDARFCPRATSAGRRLGTAGAEVIGVDAHDQRGDLGVEGVFVFYHVPSWLLC